MKSTKTKPVSPGVALGRLRAAKMTSADRSTNARTGWRRKHGPDHITADQWRVLCHLRELTGITVAHGDGAAGRRFARAARALDELRVIDIDESSRFWVEYHRGPAWVDQKHIRVASKKSE